jgi:hypothetical protein
MELDEKRQACLKMCWGSWIEHRWMELPFVACHFYGAHYNSVCFFIQAVDLKKL